MATLSCSTCGADNEEGRKFCGQCGSSLTVACQRCGFANTAADRFCGDCGTPLGPGATDHAPIPAPATAGTASERRLVSVLFADLVGFTTLSERRDPEEVRALLTDYFDRCREIVARFGGQVDKFIGDAVMAVWGATASKEDDAERAVRAALDLVDMVAKLGAEIGVSDLNARVGVYSGESSVGPGANDIGLIVGDKVNTASRLQSLAEPGTVLVGEPTFHLTSRSIAYTPMGEHTVKGKAESVAAFRADRLLSNLGGRGRAETFEAPFVGRDNELRICKDALHSVSREGRARSVSIVGQAGIGKSRLVWEFKKYVDGLVEDIFWHQGRSPSYGDGLTMWALGEMVRSRAGIAESDDETVSATRVGEMLTEYVSEEVDRDWIRPHLLSLLGLGPSTGERSEMFAAFRLFFEHISRRGTVVLVFEDLHWADAGLLDFVQEIVDWSRDQPVLVINLTRPDLLERRPTWGSGRHGLISIHLDPLARPDMAAMLDGMIVGLPERSRDEMLRHSAGIPMYAVEMVRMLIAQGDLEETGEGQFLPVGTLDQIAIPDSVSALIGARLDRLDPAGRALVQEASILGQSFTLDGLMALHPSTAAELEERLGELVRREILEVVRDPRSPDRGQYRFVQSLIREISHGRLGRVNRRDGHLRAANYYATSDDPELAGVVATHLLEALSTIDDPTEAAALRTRVVTALGSAIDRSWSLHAFEQVLSLTNEATDLLDDPDVLAPLWGRAALAANAILMADLAEEYAGRLFNYAEKQGDEPGMHAAMTLLGEILNSSNQITRAVEVLEPYVDRYMQNEEHTLALAPAQAQLARSQTLSGQMARGAATAEPALIAAELAGNEEAASQAMITRGTALSQMHRPREAMALLKGGLEIARTHSLTSVGLRALANLGYSAQDSQESILYTTEGLEEARRVGDRRMALFFLGNLASWRAFAGKYEEFNQAVEEANALDPDGTLMSAYQALAAATQGDLASARQHLAVAAGGMTGDPQAETRVEHADLVIKTIEGDLRAAYEGGLAMHRRPDGQQWLGPWVPMLCATLAHSEPHLATIVKELGLVSADTVFQGLVRRELDVYGLAARGDLGDALSQLLLACGKYELAGVPMESARLRGTFAGHLPPDHERREPLLRAALGELNEMGAFGMERLIERAATGEFEGVLDGTTLT